MPVRTSYKPGVPSWVELATPDPDGATAFYSGLFGWRRHDDPIPDGGVYSMMFLGDHAVAGMMQQDPKDAEQGIPPHWTTYITTDDVDKSAARVTELGGKIWAEPFDVMEAGRMAVAADPTGSVFALWQPNKSIGAELVNEHGSLTWNELNTRDARKAREFYRDLFDYDLAIQDMGDNGEYTTLKVGEDMAAGLMDMAPGVPEYVPSHWLDYFATDDVDATVAKAAELGGTVVVPVMDIPSVGRFAVINDPQGAMFAVITFHPVE